MSLGPRIRSHPRALCAILPVLLLLAAAGEVRCDPIRGEGGFEFYVDVSSVPSGDRGAVQLIQIAVPTKELRYVPEGRSLVAEARFTITLRSGDAVVHKRTTKMKDRRDEPPRVRDLSSFLCLIDSCSVEPGSYRLTVKVEDLHRKKLTLLGIVRRTYLESVVEDEAIEIRPFPESGIALADPILVWEFDRSGNYLPNPMRVYGLRKDTLSVFVQASIRNAAADSLDVRFSLTKDTGEPVEETLFKIPVTGERSSFVRMTDLTTYAAGAYRVMVEASAPGGLFASTGKDFSIVWELVNWQKPMRDIMLEARILLETRELSEFELMTLGEQEAFMRAFWKKLDPTPQTAVNETFETFNARVRYADNHFAMGGRGALTDRGYIYIRFGQPDDIIRKPLPQTREDLYEGVEKVASEYKIVTEGIFTERSTKDDRPIMLSEEKRRATRGTVGSDVGSFEIWDYSFKGEPLLPQDKGMTIKQGLRFLFLDKDGVGDYRLVGSSESMWGSARE